MVPTFDRLVALLRRGALDSELAALVWIVAEGGVPVHVTADDQAAADPIVEGLEDLVRPVRFIAGGSLEEVLADRTDDPALLGLVAVVGGGRVAAAHWVRPSLRDGAGHVRPQGPAVLAVWDERAGRYEHYAWGVMPELAAVVGRKAGDLELELQERRERFDRLADGDADPAGR